MKENDKLLLEFNKGLSYLQSIGKIKECFYHRKEECKGKIKQAHSLQSNGRLSVIEGDVNGENKIYTFTSYVPSEKYLFSDLKPIGRKLASTFFGFCDYHDSTLFSPIENFKYDGTDKHNFLHSYRSFAHSYHKRKEGLKSLNERDKLHDPFHLDRVEGYKLSMIDAENSKLQLDRMIENKSFSELEYFSFIIEDETFPIACSSIINPPFFYNDEPFNNSSKIEDKYSDIMLTVLPDNGQTIILLSCLPDDILGIKFLDQISELSDLDIKKAISSLIISNVENTFFSPNFWQKLGINKQKKLLREIEWNIKEHATPFYNLNSFYHSKINFFESRYSIEKMNG